MNLTLRRLAAAAALSASLPLGLLISTATAHAVTTHSVARPTAQLISRRIPEHLNLAHRTPVTSPQLATPAAGCAYYTIAEGTTSAQNLNMDVAVLGQYNSGGGYCGIADSKVCGTPTNNNYRQGLKLYNWWYANDNWVGEVSATSTPFAGQTQCLYSGGFSASSTAIANGEFVEEGAPGYAQIVGQYGEEAVF